MIRDRKKKKNDCDKITLSSGTTLENPIIIVDATDNGKDIGKDYMTTAIEMISGSISDISDSISDLSGSSYTITSCSSSTATTTTMSSNSSGDTTTEYSIDDKRKDSKKIKIAHNLNEKNAQEEEEEEDEDSNPSFEIGDHVYSWCSLLGVPFAYQHHGIVVDVEGGFVTIVDFQRFHGDEKQEETKEKEKQGRGTRKKLKSGKTNKFSSDSLPFGSFGDSLPFGNISDSFPFGNISDSLPFGKNVSDSLPFGSFGNNLPFGSVGNGIGSSDIDGAAELKWYGKGLLSEYTVEESIAKTHWHKVKYGADVWTKVTNRAGCCSLVQSDSVGLVLARVDFLLKNPDLIPPYHVMYSNCECVAVWCKTGVFSSLQAASVLLNGVGGLAGSAALMGTRAAVATAAAEVPAAGLLTAAAPWLMPAIAAYGFTSAVGPVVVLKACEKTWTETTETLNFVFMEYNQRGMFLPHSPSYNSHPKRNVVRLQCQ